MGLKVFYLKKQAHVNRSNYGSPGMEGREFRRAKKYLGTELHGWFFFEALRKDC